MLGNGIWTSSELCPQHQSQLVLLGLLIPSFPTKCPVAFGCSHLLLWCTSHLQHHSLTSVHLHGCLIVSVITAMVHIRETGLGGYS